MNASASHDVRNIFLPDYALLALDALETQEFEAWCVGGCVRDALLGRPVNDYDIATSATWPETERVLGQAGFTVHRTGTAHGTVTASLDGHAIEVTTYRADGAYTDGRHPDSVHFVTSIEEDLARRDFTINALAYHPNRGLLDCWNGRQDLENHVIRAIGDAGTRFSEDALRILRACRFASQLGFTIEPGTLSAMNVHKVRLARISAERITHEMDALLLGGHVHDALMQTADVICAVMPEMAACKGFEQHNPYHIYDVWEHIAWVVQRSPATRLARWVALFHDIGKPAACSFEGERAHFYGHATLSALMANEIMHRLKLAPAFIERVLMLVKAHDNTIAATRKSVRRALVRFDGDAELFRTLCGIKRADALAQSNLAEPRVQLAGELEHILDEVLAADEAFSIKQLAINGHDVLDLGIAPGPAVGETLAAALDAVIDERIPNEREALLHFAANTL